MDIHKNKDINNLEGEVWKNTGLCNGRYVVSNMGRVKSLNGRHKIISQENKDGYKKVNLVLNNKNKRFFVHRLVAISFIENQENKPHINHIDFNPSNNVSTNLEWCTPQENNKHSFSNGRYRKCYSLNPKKEKPYIVKCIYPGSIPKMIEVFDDNNKSIMVLYSYRNAAKFFNVNENRIQRAIQFKRKINALTLKRTYNPNEKYLIPNNNIIQKQYFPKL